VVVTRTEAGRRVGTACWPGAPLPYPHHREGWVGCGRGRPGTIHLPWHASPGPASLKISLNRASLQQERGQGQPGPERSTSLHESPEAIVFFATGAPWKEQQQISMASSQTARSQRETHDERAWIGAARGQAGQEPSCFSIQVCVRVPHVATKLGGWTWSCSCWWLYE
jgi:hypothetical protein